MADARRAEKLSAAKKLLKQHQQKTKKTKEVVPSAPAQEVFIGEESNTPPVYFQGNGNVFGQIAGAQESDPNSLASSKGSSNNASGYFAHQETSGEDVNPQHFFDQLGSNRIPQSVNCSNGPNHEFQNREIPFYNPNVNSAFTQSKIIPDNNVPPTDSYFKLYNEAVEKLRWYEREMETLKAASETKLKAETGALQEKVQFQLKSLEMVLSEKTDLHCQLESSLEELRAKIGMCEELTNRLKASRNHVSKLEKELSEVNEARMQHNTILKRLESSLQEQKSLADKYRMEFEDAQLELTSLKQNLDSSHSDCASLKREVEEKESKLSLALIKIQQLGGSDVGDALTSTTNAATEEIDRLNQRIAELTKENNQNSMQYQEYINSLNTQIQDITAKYESCLIDKEELSNRVENLVSHIGDLEKQIQKQSVNIPNSVELIEKNNAIKQELDKANKRASDLETQFNRMQVECEGLKVKLTEREVEVVELEGRLERVSGEVPDAKLLQAAMESDKVAAMRAVAQNKQLKQQLVELQDAYIKLQDNKLELTEQLDQKQRQISDLEQELSSYIKKEVSRLDGSTEMAQLPLVDGCCQTTYHDLEILESGEDVTVTPEAAKLLEDKFKKTMNKLAELSDEKNRLEHLVIQLQSETETIGEYIALYQSQRCKLEQRASEKDKLVEEISKEKEELREKLAQITSLIPNIINTNSNISIGEEAVEGQSPSPNGNETADAAVTKVMSLLTEIGSSNLVKDTNHILVDPCNNPAFHPCGLCSGKLLTI